jgi:hypothetical protein
VYFEDVQLYATRCAHVERSDDFATLDYAPRGVPAGDCAIDYQEVDVMAEAWLTRDAIIKTKPPGSTGLVVYYPLNEGDGNKVYPDPCNPLFTGTFYNWRITPPNDAPSTSWSTDHAPGIGGTACIYKSGMQDGGRVSIGTFHQTKQGIGLNPGDTNAISISVWVKWLGPRYWDPYLLSKSQGILGKRGDWSDTGMIWMLEMAGGTGGAFALRHYTGGDQRRPDLYTANNLLPIGQWAHIGATYPNPPNPPESPNDANAQARLYLNGQQVNTGAWRFSHGYDANIFMTIGDTMDINAWVECPEGFYGYIDEVRLYKRVLEANEIAYLADTSPTDGNQVVPISSSAELYTKEQEGSRVINFKDFAMLVNGWLTEEMYPPTHR